MYLGHFEATAVMAIVLLCRNGGRGGDVGVGVVCVGGSVWVMGGVVVQWRTVRVQ